ncbi:hypothetical protein BEWA_039330 [Theileria equi strain WA]|uniref:Uncharacterized protein n=1 Tax=Theileria equi strain WA TaxID=1537102 RepID=L1LF75_THEEQ|nr:hypothetical protein BEWA_039330 [Theileria equi strain WA]EKX73895.1 hypothetical protein BEWA_039330 [Theileria equi strain WA]|eukprot:XP_004833347.1 hypothetical protein BEWA_039330 [Theileria equi strain WA]
MSKEGATVEIDISKHSGSGVDKDENGYYYIDKSGGRVLLTDDWYPDPEGIYRKFTHTPKGGSIGSIYHNGRTLSEISVASHKSVSVYYWSGDNGFSKPLLIQLGDGNNYYTDPEGGSTWSKDSGITTGTLRERLNKQNCTRNQVHVIDLSDKGKSGTPTPYKCPSCDNTRSIKVYSNYSGTTFYQPYRYRSGSSFSVTSFKDASTWELGLPSIKGVRNITVEWHKSGDKFPLIYYNQGGQKFFRRNSENENTWIEVSNANGHPTGTTPNLPLDLSKSSGITYSGGSSNISITVLRSHIGDGYYRYQYSLRGAPFKVNEIKHEGIPLTGISFQDALTSVSGYYYGGKNPTDQSNLLLIELVISGSNTYQYFYRRTKDADKWTEYYRSGQETSRLQGKDLIEKLNELKKLKETLKKLDKLTELEAKLDQIKKELSESHNTSTLAGTSVGTGLGGAGLGALAVWKGPALIARLIARL